MRDVHVVLIQDGGMQAAYVTKSPKDPSSLKCEQCNKTFTRSWLLKNHQRVHTGERPYKCVFCDKAFADKSNLRQHQKIHTTTEKLFQCGICQRTFAQRRYLMKHATEIHRDVSLSLYGSPGVEKKEKEEEPVRHAVVKQMTKISTTTTAAAAAVQTTPEIPNKSAEHQYLTRQKSRTKNTSELKDEKDAKEKKYSEQDLKDFIKSNQKMMEKNGYIFIKQNFESLDTEPTLTEISEVPVTAVPDEANLKIDAETGNQILNVNGKMVYLQMENKPFMEQLLSQNSKATSQSMSESHTPGTISNVLKGRKLVSKKDTGIRRQANILKAGGAKKGHENPSSGNTIKFVNVGNVKQATSRPVQLIPSLSQNVQSEPVTLVQVMPPGPLPVPQNQGPYVIPVSVIQMPQQIQPIIAAPSLSSLKTVTLPSINTVSVHNTNVNSTANSTLRAHSSPQVIEIQTVPVAVDEKGAASDFSESQVVTSTPIVSDAPWQGIVNINSEQELLEYINSQSVSTVETDQGMTILIQNVDSQNGTVMSLDSQSLLSSSGNFSNVFQDQTAIISDVLPESGTINEVQINSEDGGNQNSNQLDGDGNIDKTDNSEVSNLVIKEEASNDSDDAQSQVMLTEANREHLSDQEDFTDHHDEKILNKSENGSNPDPFSDHALYTAHEVKCEIDEKPHDLMETDTDMVTVENTPENIVEVRNADFKEES